MTREQKFFLQVLSDYCQEGKEEKLAEKSDQRYDETVSLEELFRLAEEQSLAGVVYAQCGAWLQWEKHFSKAFNGDVFYSVNRADLLQEIADRFKEKDIPFVCMKGAVFRDYWPDPELRTMGDIDLIIHTRDREAVDRILCGEMSFQKYVDNHAVWTYSFGSLELEVHDHMFYEYLSNQVDYRSYFDHVWEHVKTGAAFGVTSDILFVPEENFHFLYLMTHTAKHVINKGIGFRAFLDMVFMVRACGNRLDWSYLERELRRLKLLDFTRICFAFCQRWLNVQMPLSPPRLKADFYEYVTAKAFQDGTFGLENEDNTAAHSAKEIRRSREPYLSSAFRIVIKDLFPPYKDMQLIPWYSWVDGRPYLLPAAWVYRWFYCLFHKGRHSVELLTEPLAKKKIIEKREHYLSQWGL